MKKGRDREKVQKQDELSTIIVNYSDKIIRKFHTYTAVTFLISIMDY